MSDFNNLIWNSESNLHSVGKYASAEDLPFTPKQFIYSRHGYLILHTEKEHGILDTKVQKYNRIQPLTNNLCECLPPLSNDKIKTQLNYNTPMLNSCTKLAWDSNPKYL